ncbi:hypothetical protein M9H77_20931 [Catharanthus roseus]|uniref:Uncharacterized protein n=1 Tax=Catharanthus roseus TaxID=4058 RepID=A0ACC0ANU7_CATRO|nr:hypothetical protein M9H77_20931 [Catharanthus roseus]
MEKFRVLQKLGSGSFGNVYKASLKEDENEVFAIKELKSEFGNNMSFQDCLDMIEIKCLRTLKHPNIIRLQEVIRRSSSLFLVFECMDGSLRDRILKRKGYFSEDETKKFCFQILKGLAYIHRNGFFHRDLKPENILVSGESVKIADFGSAKEINSKPPYADYVTTRWYRAPEVILGEERYGPAVDMWAMGAIMAEFFGTFALFPGEDSRDQLYQICRVLGSPTETEWPKGHELAKRCDYEFPKIDEDKEGVPLCYKIPFAKEEAFDLIKSLLRWDPSKRATAMEALKHPFFDSCYNPVITSTRISFKRKMNMESAEEEEDQRADDNDFYNKLFGNKRRKRAIRTKATLNLELML